jgi:hypothetical protein
MKITGYINDPISSIQPLNATATIEAGTVSGLSPNLVVLVSIDNLSILRSVSVAIIHILSATDGINNQFFNTNACKLLATVNNTLYFQTPFLASSYTASNFSARVVYDVSLEDITLLRYISERTTAQLLIRGCKKVTPSNNALDFPSFIQNLGTDNQTLIYEDAYGNTDTITPKPDLATYFLVTKVKTGSGTTLYQLYSK